jgi:hypothetical protein
MAELNHETQMLSIVHVAVRVVAGLERLGSAQASGLTTAVPTSFARHLPPGYPRTDMDPKVRYVAANTGAAHSAPRAGRPSSSAGVTDSRSLAITAGRAILSGWSPVTRGTDFVAPNRHEPYEAMTPTPADRLLSGHHQPLACLSPLSPAGTLFWPRSERSEKRGQAERARKALALGMPSVSAW